MLSTVTLTNVEFCYKQNNLTSDERSYSARVHGKGLGVLKELKQTCMLYVSVSQI